MYDDLFGDLPMAKGNTTGGNNNTDTATCGATDKDVLDKGTISTKSTNSIFETKGEATTTKTTTAAVKAKTKSKSMIVQTLGNAGKTTSFIPLALRRKRPANTNPNTHANAANSTASKKKEVSSRSSELSGLSTGTVVNVIIGDKGLEQHSDGGIADNKMHYNPPVIIQSKTSLPITEIHDNSTVTASNNNILNNSNHKEDDNGEDDDDDRTLIEDIEDEIKEKNTQENDNQEDNYVESEELQKLHSSVHPYDMYDPMEPNDYLTYRKNKKNEMLRKDLERQAKKTLQLQQQLRKHIQEERKKVLESGDVDKIIESSAGSGSGVSIDAISAVGVGRGRGRGRGLNNLPAWLIQKQKEKEQQRNDAVNKKNQKEGQFDECNDNGLSNSKNNNKSSNFTVVLTNMVGPGEVDDELQDEVKEECEEKCGKVINVRIEERNQQVQVFVTFQNVDDANKAPTIFHGRMFGQRQISAQIL